jgi:2-hydroxy-4-(methylsulfanyl)butanoate S-methyltransferase
LPRHCANIYNLVMQPAIKPTTIFRHAYGIYPPMAMLAGMQLDVFTPLKDGPMTAAALASALTLETVKLRPLLYALVHAELLNLVEGDRFANTPEADVYLVRGRRTYLGSSHELYSDLWSAALTAGESIRAGRPQVKHDFRTMSDKELGAFFRGLHAGALATGRQLATAYNFERFRSLLDVGGGSGGVSIAACQNCHNLKATVLELPRVAPMTQDMVRESKLVNRVQVIVADILERAPEGRFDVAVLRSLIQVLGPDAARRALRNVGEAINRGGWLFIVGHVLEDNRLAPAAAVCLNLTFLSVYDEGQAYTEREHRTWLAEAGFDNIDVHYSAATAGASIVIARKTT